MTSVKKMRQNACAATPILSLHIRIEQTEFLK